MSLSSLRQAFPSTQFAQQLNLSYPIIQAPMSPLTSPELVASVCQAGGLGSIAAARMKPNKLREEIDKVRSLLPPSQPFAVNLFIPKPGTTYNIESIGKVEAVLKKVDNFIYPLSEQKAKSDSNKRATPPPNLSSNNVPSTSPSSTSCSGTDYESQVEIVLSTRVPVFSWTFGIPNISILQECRRLGIYTIGTATTPAEAATLSETGLVSAIVVQGSEAGGHRGTFLTPDNETIEKYSIGLMSLLPLCKEVVHPTIPLIAAGGLMTGRSVIAALLLGASGVQMGTAFLTATECTLIAPAHKQLLLQPDQIRVEHSNNGSDEGEGNKYRHKLAESYQPTALTRAFSGRPARGVYNQMIREFSNIDQDILPWGLQAAKVQPYAQAAAAKGDGRFMQMWAGQSYPFCKEKSSKQIIEEIIQEANSLLRD